MKVLIVDDHTLFREGLAHVLAELEQNISFLNAVGYDSAIQLLIENVDLDLVLLDLDMPGKDGFSVLNEFRKTNSTIPVIILSASNRISDVQRVLDAGAVGFIPKNTTSKLMLSAIKVILSGGIYFPQSLKKSQVLINDESGTLLTSRQQEVLDQLVLGSSNKKIADVLGITEGTTKMHITSILKKLGVNNRTQAAMAVKGLNSR